MCISAWTEVFPLLVLLCGSPCCDVFFNAEREKKTIFFNVGMQVFHILRLSQVLFGFSETLLGLK